LQNEKRPAFRGRQLQQMVPFVLQSAKVQTMTVTFRRFNPETGFSETDRIACPEFTGSYLSYDGDHLYLSQWYKHRILKLDASGKILRVINVGKEICGHAFVDGSIYVLRGKEQPNEDWRIARLDPRQETPEVQDIAVVPFACRSLTFDGTNFWASHRAANEIESFALPD
jgi:hypothetical protein